jgi:hypothetical protein
MNSKQRRHKRVFEHEVTIHAKSNEPYFEYDQKVEKAKMWLQWRTKRKNYVLGTRSYQSQTFKFRDGSLATLFALKWLN